MLVFVYNFLIRCNSPCTIMGRPEAILCPEPGLSAVQDPVPETDSVQDPVPPCPAPYFCSGAGSSDLVQGSGTGVRGEPTRPYRPPVLETGAIPILPPHQNMRPGGLEPPTSASAGLRSSFELRTLYFYFIILRIAFYYLD